MEGLNLLQRAREAGLTIRATDGDLLIRGPRSAADLVQELAAQKALVLQALEGEHRSRPSCINSKKLIYARRDCDWCRGTGLVPYLTREPLSTSNFIEGSWTEWTDPNVEAKKLAERRALCAAPNYCPMCFSLGLPNRWPANEKFKDPGLLLGKEGI